ncbi:MAG: DUF4298 domain-containing protein [Clostridia bacterium]|nr:DUF4298 domain-containing protein [Clostridia bacterium]
MKNKETQKERISRFEKSFDRISNAAKNLKRAIEEFEKLRPEAEALSAYYESGLWKRDYEDDEAGRLPRVLKRGVLSQDGVYNLLEETKELEKRILAGEINDG